MIQKFIKILYESSKLKLVLQHFCKTNFLDPECFSLKTDTNQTTEWPVMNYTKAEMAPLQQNESTQTTSAGTFLHIETTTDATQVTDIQKRPTDTPGIKFPTVFFARGLQYVENFIFHIHIKMQNISSM